MGTSDLKKKASKPQLIRLLPKSPGPACLARCYPEGFARRLKALWEGRRGIPGHLRHRGHVNPALSDREVFERAPLGDPWVDAGMQHVWKYLWKCKHVDIPDSWIQAMRDFDKELTRVVPRLS